MVVFIWACLIPRLFFYIGQQYFVPNPNTGVGISPKWDFTSSAFKGNPDAFVVANIKEVAPAPTGPNDIDWARLEAIDGPLAKMVYITDTRGGQPPATVSLPSCTKKKKNSEQGFFKKKVYPWLISNYSQIYCCKL